MSQSKERNCSIDVFRYVCAIMVIMHHTRCFMDVNQTLGYVIIEICPRFVIPFFLAVSGYFYIPKLLTGKPVFWPYISKILQIYVIWSIPYLVVNYYNQVVKGGRGLISFLLGSIKSFVLDGVTEHFWYFPALIFAVGFTTLIYKLRGERFFIPLAIFFFVVGCLGSGYYAIGKNIPGLNRLYHFPYYTVIRRWFLMGYPFLAGGYLIRKIENKVKEKKQVRIFWGISIAVFIAEMAMIHILQLHLNIILTFALYPLMCTTILMLLKHPVYRKADVSRLYNTLAKFAYYTHPLFMMLITWVCYQTAGYEISQTPLCIVTVILTFVSGFIIYKCNWGWLNKLVL